MARKIIKGPVLRPAGYLGTIKSRARLTEPTRIQPVSMMQIPETIPAGLAGKYAVWSPDGLRLVGSGSTIAEALAIADLEDGRLIQRVPKAIRARSPGGTEPTTIEG